MIITRTPVRISFLGGGTDYPAYFLKQGGQTLAATIDKYTIITVHPLTQFADYRLRVHYSQVESVGRVDEIQHPSARECLRHLEIDGGVEIHYISDLPARTGLGSSSSATVGLLMALKAFKGETAPREQVAREAVHVEQKLIKENIGCQDQYACALGGLLHLEFDPSGTVKANPVQVTFERLKVLEARLMLLYTGIQRHAHEVLGEQIRRTASGANGKELADMKSLVAEGAKLLAGRGDLSRFGGLLHENWMLKRRLSSRVTTPWIDDLYDKARKAGAVGGKLLGAGGGGFFLLDVEPERRESVKKALPELPEVKFSFENSGCQLIVTSPA